MDSTMEEKPRKDPRTQFKYQINEAFYPKFPMSLQYQVLKLEALRKRFQIIFNPVLLT